MLACSVVRVGVGGWVRVRVRVEVGVRVRVRFRVRVALAGRKASSPSIFRSAGTSSAPSGAAMHFIHVHCSATSSEARASEMAAPKRISCST